MHRRNGQREKYVFVNYARADVDQVRPIIDGLREAGFDVWIDETSLAGGDNYGPAIVDAIRRCAAVAVNCSKRAYQSRNVQQEVAIA
ncbi:hypothetical protein BH23CHL5_BH23CHL5_21090 [soil metagenome]